MPQSRDLLAFGAAGLLANAGLALMHGWFIPRTWPYAVQVGLLLAALGAVCLAWLAASKEPCELD